MLNPDQVNIPVNRRGLTLIRVAMIQRLAALKERGLEDSKSYRETQAWLNGALWECSQELRGKGF